MARAQSASLASWRRQAVRRIEAVRRSTLAFIATLLEDAIVRPRTLDQWSVKDLLAHLMSCDEETVRRFKLIARGRGDRIFWFRSMADADRFNARTVGQARRLGPATRSTPTSRPRWTASSTRCSPAPAGCLQKCSLL